MRYWSLIATIFASAAAATTVVELSAVELAERAETIVRVRVTASEARYVGQRIVTFHDVSILEVLKGKLTKAEARDEAISVGVPGGVIAGHGQSVAGAPRLARGQEWLLYLGRARGPDGARGIVGIFQGAHRITRSPSGTSLSPGSTHEGTPVIPRSLDVLRASLKR